MSVIGDLAVITGKVLSSLGESTMQALFWELSRQGVTTSPEQFDIRKFDEELKKIFGDGANVFMEEIYSQFKGQIQERNAGNLEIAIENEGELEPVEKILKVLSLKVMN